MTSLTKLLAALSIFALACQSVLCTCPSINPRDPPACVEYRGKPLQEVYKLGGKKVGPDQYLWERRDPDRDDILVQEIKSTDKSITLDFSASKTAPNVFRQIGVLLAGAGQQAFNDSRYYWLTGNGLGLGALCQWTLDVGTSQISKTMTVHEGDQVPPGRCS